jgi:hypothetical protein
MENLNKGILKRRKLKNSIFKVLVFLSTMFGVVILAILLFLYSLNPSI